MQADTNSGDGIPPKLETLLRNGRTRRGWGINALALQAGVSPSTISRWEAGTTRPGIPELEAVLTVLGVEPDEMRNALRSLSAPRALRKLRQMEPGAGVPPPMAGDLLWAMRKRKNKTQTETARAAGVTQAQIARWEKGEAWPDAQKTAHALLALRGAARRNCRLDGRLGAMAPLCKRGGRCSAIRQHGRGGMAIVPAPPFVRPPARRLNGFGLDCR